MEIEFDWHDKQEEALSYLTEDNGIDEVCYGGAKNGGKSMLGVSWTFGNALMYPGTFWFIARNELNDLRKFTVPTIHEYFKIAKLKFETYCKFNANDNVFTLHNGSKVFLLQCKYLPSDEMFERFGSMQFTGGWIEEAGEVNYLAYENLKLSIGRWLNDQYGLAFKLLITCNPKKNFLYTDFYKPWSQGRLEKNKRFIQALVTDNKFRQKGAVDVLDKIKSKITKERLRFGNWEYSQDPSCLMDYDDIISIFTNAHVQATGKKYITVDVARFGKDKTIIRVWHGWRVIHKVKAEKQSTKITAEQVKSLAIKFGVPHSQIMIDEDGIGGGVVDQIKGCKGFIANSSPINPKPGDDYRNLKTQAAYKLAEVVKAKEIYEDATPEEQEILIQDLENIKEWKVDSDKKRQIMPKEEVIKNIQRSPDDGDTLIMRAAFDLAAKGFAAPSNKPQTASNGRSIHNM
jgi:phage terminase large subunit